MSGVKGLIVLVVIEADQAKDDSAAIVRVSHDFDADTVGDLALAIEHASTSAQRQLRFHASEFRRLRDAAGRRDAMRAL